MDGVTDLNRNGHGGFSRALHCTTLSTHPPLNCTWAAFCIIWCMGNRQRSASFPKFNLPRQCHSHQTSCMSFKIQIFVGITKLHGTGGPHLWIVGCKSVTAVKELCFLITFSRKKEIAEIHRMLKNPFWKLLQQCQVDCHKDSQHSCEKLQVVSQSFHRLVFRGNLLQRKISECAFRGAIQTKAQMNTWSQDRSQYPPQIVMFGCHSTQKEIFGSHVCILCNWNVLGNVLFIKLVTSGAGKTSFRALKNFTTGNFLLWLPSYLRSPHVIWRKPSKITTQLFQNFTPG